MIIILQGKKVKSNKVLRLKIIKIIQRNIYQIIHENHKGKLNQNRFENFTKGKKKIENIVQEIEKEKESPEDGTQIRESETIGKFAKSTLDPKYFEKEKRAPKKKFLKTQPLKEKNKTDEIQIKQSSIQTVVESRLNVHTDNISSNLISLLSVEKLDSARSYIPLGKDVEFSIQPNQPGNLGAQCFAKKKCQFIMKINRTIIQASDGYNYRCSNRDCRSRACIREGTLFKISKLTIMEIARLIFHYYVRTYNAAQAHSELREMVNEKINPYGVPGNKFKHEDDVYRLNYKAVFTMYKHARQQIHIWTQNLYRKTKLGKFGRTVEIDESVFSHEQRDGKNEKVWVLGFYERQTKEARAIKVKDRSEETLTQVILENVEEGAEIYTDFWRGYNSLKTYYTHRVVNKAMKGYGTSEFQTTNHVECLCLMVKTLWRLQMNLIKMMTFFKIMIQIQLKIRRMNQGIHLLALKLRKKLTQMKKEFLI
ncbi:UNKNOWN [Stylonychia lemnae]|uniref:ISXO2-like transposase domain-containing protein n=1 Tax=Stylonychia lemnae TaxID=5949 RepID=A0A077ZPW4_STYLE|nr:UNKNOWN [Stylonychia lemnae]|eukprot:CDW71499.1 UNKNOWN [Stylonychia lemnae]